MNHKEIEMRAMELFSNLAEADEVTLDSELVDDLGISSMDILYVVSCLEEEFHVKISEKDIRKIYTVGDVVDLVCELCE